MPQNAKHATTSEGFGTMECKEFIRWPRQGGEDDKLSNDKPFHPPNLQSIAQPIHQFQTNQETNQNKS